MEGEKGSFGMGPTDLGVLCWGRCVAALDRLLCFAARALGQVNRDADWQLGC
jgi:hypothetical protein